MGPKNLGAPARGDKTVIKTEEQDEIGDQGWYLLASAVGGRE